MKLTTDDIKYFQSVLKQKSEIEQNDPRIDGIIEDTKLYNIVNSDSYNIIERARDKYYNINYNNAEGFISDENGCRSYCLTSGGGICIYCDSDHNPSDYMIITLAEDDGSYFICSRNIWCTAFFDSKNAFLDCLSRAISLFNNNVYENN